MRFETKRRVTAIGLLFFAAWPLVHRGLVAAYDFNPWHLFGWSMYCVPDLPTRVQLFAVVGYERTLLRTNDPDARGLAAALRDYLKRRAVYGRLASLTSLVDEAYRNAPNADAIEVRIDRLFLDTRTARIDVRREGHVFERRPAARARP